MSDEFVFKCLNGDDDEDRPDIYNRGYDHGYTKGYYDGHFQGRREGQQKLRGKIVYPLERLQREVRLIQEELNHLEGVIKDD